MAGLLSYFGIVERKQEVQQNEDDEADAGGRMLLSYDLDIETPASVAASASADHINTEYDDHNDRGSQLMSYLGLTDSTTIDIPAVAENIDDRTAVLAHYSSSSSRLYMSHLWDAGNFDDKFFPPSDRVFRPTPWPKPVGTDCDKFDGMFEISKLFEVTVLCFFYFQILSMMLSQFFQTLAIPCQAQRHRIPKGWWILTYHDCVMILVQDLLKRSTVVRGRHMQTIISVREEVTDALLKRGRTVRMASKNAPVLLDNSIMVDTAEMVECLRTIGVLAFRYRSFAQKCPLYRMAGLEQSITANVQNRILVLHLGMSGFNKPKFPGLNLYKYREDARSSIQLGNEDIEFTAVNHRAFGLEATNGGSVELRFRGHGILKKCVLYSEALHWVKAFAGKIPNRYGPIFLE